jgi:hypothetical protein
MERIVTSEVGDRLRRLREAVWLYTLRRSL